MNKAVSPLIITICVLIGVLLFAVVIPEQPTVLMSASLIGSGLLLFAVCILLEERQATHRIELSLLQSGWRGQLQDGLHILRRNTQDYIQIIARSINRYGHPSASIVLHFLPNWQDELPRHVKSREAIALVKRDLENSWEVERIRVFLFNSLEYPDKKPLEEEYFERNPVWNSS